MSPSVRSFSFASAFFRSASTNASSSSSKIVRGSTETAKRFHNPILSDHDQAVAYVTREWEPERVRTRYDWLFEYDPLTTPL